MSNVTISFNALSEAETTARCITEKLETISKLQMSAYASKDNDLFDSLSDRRAFMERKLNAIRSTIKVINHVYWRQRGSYVS